MPQDEITIKQVEPFRALTLRFTAQNHRHFAEVWAEIRTTLYVKSFRASAHPIHIIYADEYLEDHIDNEIVLPTDDSWAESIVLASAGTMTVRTLPDITAAAYLHSGNPNRINERHDDVLHWAAEHGYQLGGSMRLIYLRGPVERGEEYLIEVQHPLRNFRNG